MHVIVTSVNPIEGLIDLDAGRSRRGRAEDAEVAEVDRTGRRKAAAQRATGQCVMSEKVYGLHAVRALLTRHAERVRTVTIAERATIRA